MGTTIDINDASLVGDSLIAAHAVEHAATVHSDDRDFRRFGGLRWHNPLA
jgi:predicted nucleic acid-binding protein